MLLSVQRSAIFNEFSEKEQKYWFGIKEKAVAHHVDTLYYNVFIVDDCNNNPHKGMIELLKRLEELRDQKRTTPSAELEFFDMAIECKGAAGNIYLYHLSEREYYDIFFTDYLPNDKTPRIHVQLRTKALVEMGLHASIEESFYKVKDLLHKFGLKVAYCDVNRIDYAFHTNAIQRPSVEFSDAKLGEHLDTSFIDGTKHFYLRRKRSEEILEEHGISKEAAEAISECDDDKLFELDYVALGNRRSNHLFFRAYEKGKEIVEKNYKGFFLKRWRDRGLISRYDEYVYQAAYKYGFYKMGLLAGRINWYLEYGSDPELRQSLKDLLESCFIKSSNSKQIEKKIRGILPPVTVVMNIEYETKKSFYNRQKGRIDAYRFKHTGPEELYDVYKILDMRRVFIDKLTTQTVAFRENGADFESDMLDWWKRLHRTRIEGIPDKEHFKTYYEYSRNLDAGRLRTRALNSLASFALVNSGSEDEKTLGQDFWALMSNLNDNDIEGSFVEYDFEQYKALRRRKTKQLSSMLRAKKLQSKKK